MKNSLNFASTCLKVVDTRRSTAMAEGPTGKYYRTVIRDSYPGRPSVRAKATQEVSNALKLRHPRRMTPCSRLPNSLTLTRMARSLVKVRFARSVLVAVLGLALAAYAFDCGGTTTPEQAMQCCNSMPCSSHGHHGQDCCKTMPAMHAPFVQPSSAHRGAYSPLVLAVLPAPGESQSLRSADRLIATHCHAPPILSRPAPLPLRI